MKTRKVRSKPTVIPTSRWAGYAAAGAATAFAGISSAEATIHYSGIINQKFEGDHSGSFQLDQPDDFLFSGMLV